MNDATKRLPGFLQHTSASTPVPTWEQVTRTLSSSKVPTMEHVTRILGGTQGAGAAREKWDLLPGDSRRSVALLIDKIYHEGGSIRWRNKRTPWDGGFFEPRTTSRGTLAEVLDSKSNANGGYTACLARNGLFAYLSRKESSRMAAKLNGKRRSDGCVAHGNL